MNLSELDTREISELCFKDVETLDPGPALQKLEIPTLVVVGRFDANAPVINAYRIHQAIPRSKLVIFERSAHMPWFEESDAFVKTVEDFLR